MTKAFPGVHHFLTMVVCDRCGFKAPRDHAGKAIMREHVREHEITEGTAP